MRFKMLYTRLASLRWKLFFSYLAISIIPLLFYASTALRTVEEVYLDENRQDLLNYANRLATNIANENFITDPGRVFVFDRFVRDERDISAHRIIVIDYTGMVINDSSWADARLVSGEGRMLFSPDVLNALDGRSSWSVAGGYMNVAVAIPSREVPGGVAGAVLVIASLHEMSMLISSMQQNLLLLTVLLTIIILMLVFFISQLIIEPLKNILGMVKKISDGHLDQRVKFYGRDEFAELGDSFNRMTERLSLVDESRSEFVSNVSHELKTPLSSIKVLSESMLLQDNMEPHVFKEFLTDINSEIDRMTRIINDLLALVMLDRTEQILNLTSFKLNNLVEDICKRLKPLADQKHIGLYLDDPVVVTLEGDEMKLSLALSNVIENGIKYTNEGGHVSITLDADNQYAILTVKDTGIGISEADQTKIYDRFYRVDKTRTRATGGTGLGLSITHRAILLHNGSIRIQSKENEGTTFVIKIPMIEAIRG